MWRQTLEGITSISRHMTPQTKIYTTSDTISCALLYEIIHFSTGVFPRNHFSNSRNCASGHKTMPERSVRSWEHFCVRSLMWGRKAMVKNRWVAWRAIRSPHFQSPLFHLATFSSQYSKMLIVRGLRCFFPAVSGTCRQKLCESDDVYPLARL